MQHFIESGLSLLLKASWQGAILIFLVLIAQKIFRKSLSPRWRYGLWLLVAIRLALPWTIPSKASLFNFPGFREVSAPFAFQQFLGNAAVSPMSQPSDASMTSQSTPRSAPKPSVPARNLSRIYYWLLTLWLAGTAGFLAVILTTHYRISKKVGRHRPLTDEPVLNLLENCKEQMGVRAPVILVEASEVGSPTLFGFLRPRILLPGGMTQSFSLEELRYVFLHELSHIKCHDILIGWLMTGLQMVHWFNPLVWVAAYRMRVDRELACDAMALSYTGEGENQNYGRTIIKLLEGFGRSVWIPSLAGAAENKKQMEERIRMIARFSKTSRGLGMAAALFASLGFIALTDAQSAPSELAKQLIGTWVLAGTEGGGSSAPAAGGRLKLITNQSWSVEQSNPESGASIFHHGGTWALNGDEYSETVEYASTNTSGLVHHTFKFSVKVNDDTLTMTGLGNPWKEMWKRVTPDSQKAHKVQPARLEGKWSGQETGKDVKGSASLVIKDSMLEFHGADKDEWYKASFTLYDTDPLQLVAVVKDCPSAEYVGMAACAIYKLEDGRLTISAYRPGVPLSPASFDAEGARKIVFTRK